MKKLLIALSLCALAFGFTQTVPFDPGETLPSGPFATFRVIDGDTFTVLQDVAAPAPEAVISGGMSGGAALGGAPTITQVERSIRVLGIDTPELHPLQPFAQEATDLANTLLAGKVTTLNVSGADRYGRTLAQVSLQDTGQDFALLMLQSGFAELRADADFLPQLSVYQAGLAGAESVGKGLWEGTPFRDRNCGAFTTHVEAQAFFDGATTPAKPDPHRLDGNKDGIVCLNLP